MHIRTQRPGGPVFFTNWDSYLSARSAGGSQSLCRVLDQNVSDWRGAAQQYTNDYNTWLESQISLQRAAGAEVTKLEAELADGGALGNVPQHHESIVARWAYPWITPVLGTGCLDTNDETGPSILAGRPRALRDHADGWDLLPDGEVPAELVERFARSLISRKVADPLVVADSADETTDDALLEVTARSLLCAALLSLLYHRAAALVDAPPLTDTEHLYLDTDRDHPLGGELKDALVTPVRKHLKLLSDVVQDPGATFVRTVIEEVRQDLDLGRPRLRRLDATLFAEIAWHYLTHKTTYYAGWEGILFNASLESNNAARDMRWPQIEDLAGEPLRKWLVDGIETTTNESWATRHGGVSTARDTLYDSVANLLAAQALLDEQALDEQTYGTAFPPGVAFVTSLDIELEMALIARPSPFVMVVPFELIQAAATPKAYLVWLYTIVQPDGDAETIEPVRRPQEWSLLTPDTFEDDHYHASGMPIVVRLAGSPLVAAPTQLPKINKDPKINKERLVELGIPSISNYTLRTAVIIDEYTGLHHLSTDFQTSREDRTVRDLGLPRELLASRVGKNLKAGPGSDVSEGQSDTPAQNASDGSPPSPKHPPRLDNRDARFWLLLGVQIGDDAIRSRMASLLSAARIEAPATFRTGLAVVRRSQPQDRDIFHWLGLDVVAARAAEVQPALRHYAEHLEHYPNNRRMLGGGCPLDGER